MCIPSVRLNTVHIENHWAAEIPIIGDLYVSIKNLIEADPNVDPAKYEAAAVDFTRVVVRTVVFTVALVASNIFPLFTPAFAITNFALLDFSVQLVLTGSLSASAAVSLLGMRCFSTAFKVATATTAMSLMPLATITSSLLLGTICFWHANEKIFKFGVVESVGTRSPVQCTSANGRMVDPGE